MHWLWLWVKFFNLFALMFILFGFSKYVYLNSFIIHFSNYMLCIKCRIFVLWMPICDSLCSLLEFLSWLDFELNFVEVWKRSQLEACSRSIWKTSRSGFWNEWIIISSLSWLNTIILQLPVLVLFLPSSMHLLWLTFI